ncbi:MAG: BamA/TamA family outer membrane protein [Bacteroidales bacterium]
MRLKLLNKGCGFLFYALVFVVGGLVSCRPARHIPEDGQLLDRYRIEAPENNIEKDEINNFVRQKPNKRILGLRFHLWLHNLANPDRDGWPHNWLRQIGEEPVIYDSFVTRRSATQIEQYLRNKGYYKAEVDDTVRFRKNRARVTYILEPREPYHIASVNYNFEDQGLAELILADTSASLVRPGIIFDVDVLQDERIRLENYLKNKGYYYFSREHVYFNADTTLGNMSVDLTLGISRFRERQEDGEFVTRPHQRYRIGNVYILPSYNPREAIDRPDDYDSESDTLVFREMYYLFREEMPVSPRVLAQSNFVLPGEIYSKENVDRTYRHLLALRLYRLVNIRFAEADTDSYDTTGYNVLDAWLQLTPFSRQSYTVELEGTNSSGDFGFGGNLSYQNRNFFGGAEIFDFRITGAVETLNEYYSRSFRNTYEYGAEAGLQIPRFMLPVRSISFVRRYNPRTNISMAYNYQLRPDYNRTIANARFGYSWKGSDYTTHIVNPVELNLVRLPYFTHEFDSIIKYYNLEASFRDHMVSETNYSFIFNNQDIRKTHDFVYFRFNTETAGNILTALSRMGGRPAEDGYYRLFGTGFAQYFKVDVDLRYYRMLYGGNSMVYRFFAGAGLPYGNSSALPFEKKYFSGGANSIRAWQVRSLGPGSFHEPADRSFPNRTADIKIEANLEYRFDLFWLMEGALFLDAGNIWAINDNDKREGALFRINRFYYDIAVGTGMGLRFDFSFFIFRLDMGLKLRNPAEPEDRRWIPMHRRWNYNDDVTFNIGIGYPF